MSTIKTWNRLLEGMCVSCGEPLIDMENAKLNMCTQCLKLTRKAAMKQIRNYKSRTGNVKRFKYKIGGIGYEKAKS